MEKTRSGQGRSRDKLKCNHDVMWITVRFFAALLYIAFMLELYSYMANH